MGVSLFVVVTVDLAVVGGVFAWLKRRTLFSWIVGVAVFMC